jgi:DNA-binding HxlR family transcriptional regulator
MPDFVHDGKTYYNPVELAMDRIGGLWKMPILWRLRNEPRRYSELKRSIRHISDKVLSSQLKELERHGYIDKQIYAEVPPRTEYALTQRGRDVVPLIAEFRAYGLRLMEELGIDTSVERLAP